MMNVVILRCNLLEIAGLCITRIYVLHRCNLLQSLEHATIRGENVIMLQRFLYVSIQSPHLATRLWKCNCFLVSCPARCPQTWNWFLTRTGVLVPWQWTFRTLSPPYHQFLLLALRSGHHSWWSYLLKLHLERNSFNIMMFYLNQPAYNMRGRWFWGLVQSSLSILTYINVVPLKKWNFVAVTICSSWGGFTVCRKTVTNSRKMR